MATVLDSGKMPIKYTVEENKYILSDVTSQDLNIVFLCNCWNYSNRFNCINN